MDQLLNAGAGYGYNMPPMKDPDDNRTDDERFRDGCLTAIVELIVLVVLLSLFACFSSCNTSRNVCGVTTSEGDALTHYIDEHLSVERQDTSVAHTASVFNSCAVDSTTTDETETETVTEQITETTDSLGRKTVTTNRTTTRQRKTTAQSQSYLNQYQQEIALQIHISRLDSLAKALHHDYYNHWNDSTAQLSTTQPSFLHDVRIYVEVIIRALLIAMLVFIAYLTAKYYKGK